MNTEDCKELESATRRNLEGAVVHHGDLVSEGWYLVLHGVKWAVRPLVSASGAQFTPEFRDGECHNLRMQGAVKQDNDRLTALAETISGGMPVEEETCETCGQVRGAELAVDLDAHSAFLCNVTNYAATLLRQQYELTDEQLSRLLAYSDSALPRWIIEVARHVHNLPAIVKPATILGGKF